MLREIRPAIVLVIALALITGLAYPFAVTGIAGKMMTCEGTMKSGKLADTGFLIANSSRLTPLLATTYATKAFCPDASTNALHNTSRTPGTAAIAASTSPSSTR